LTESLSIQLTEEQALDYSTKIIVNYVETIVRNFFH